MKKKEGKEDSRFAFLLAEPLQKRSCCVLRWGGSRAGQQFSFSQMTWLFNIYMEMFSWKLEIKTLGLRG